MPRARFLLVAAALAAMVAAARPASGEDAFTRTGVFRHLVEDDFSGSKSRNVYELETDEGDVLPLRFASPPAARTGERVSVTGWPGRHAFEVDEIHSVGLGRMALGRTALSAWTTGPKRVLVMLLNFTDDSSFNATTVTNTQNLFFGAGSSVANYYNEASYGLTTMTGDVVLVTATVPKPTTCDTGTIQSQANARALAAGYNPANYNFPVWVFPSIGACGWSGLGYVGGGGSWIKGAPRGRGACSSRRTSWATTSASPTPTRGTAGPRRLRRPAARAASTATASTRWVTRAPATSTPSSRTRSGGCRRARSGITPAAAVM